MGGVRADAGRAAQRRGIPYEVESNAAQPVAPTASKVNYVETDAHLYANKAQLAALGVGGLNAMAAQKGKRLILFKSPDDLPPEARAKHDRIVQVGDPDSFVFEG